MRLPKHVRDTFCSIAFELALALRVSVFRFLGSCCITLRTSNAFHVPCVVQQRRHTQNQVGKPIPTCQCTRVHKCTIARLLNERLLLCAQEGRERNAAFTRHISSRFRCGVRLFPITILRSTTSSNIDSRFGLTNYNFSILGIENWFSCAGCSTYYLLHVVLYYRRTTYY